MAATAACFNFKNCQIMGVLVDSSILSGALRQVKLLRPPIGTDAASVGTPEIFVLSTACSKAEYGKRTAGKFSLPLPFFLHWHLWAAHRLRLSPLPAWQLYFCLQVEAITLDSLLCHWKSFCICDAAAERRSAAHVCTQD